MSEVAAIERRIRHLRTIIWDCETEEQEREMDRQLMEAKASLFKAREREEPVQVGPFSGLTRRELAMTGTCETDWY